MEKLIDTIIEERSKIGLFHDSISAQWAEMANEEGMDQVQICDYLTNIIVHTITNTTSYNKEKCV